MVLSFIGDDAGNHSNCVWVSTLEYHDLMMEVIEHYAFNSFRGECDGS